MEIRENENLNRKSKGELYFVIILFVIALILFFVIYSTIPNLTIMAGLTIKTFPLSSIILLLIFLTIHLVNLARKISLIKINVKGKSDKIEIKKEFNEFNNSKKVFIFFLLIVIYFLSLNFISYQISSSVFCVIVSFFLGCRKGSLLLFVFLFPHFVNYIFHQLLFVPLP